MWNNQADVARQPFASTLRQEKSTEDSLYGGAWTFSEDGTICYRNWLHRYRLVRALESVLL